MFGVAAIDGVWSWMRGVQMLSLFVKKTGSDFGVSASMLSVDSAAMG